MEFEQLVELELELLELVDSGMLRVAEEPEELELERSPQTPQSLASTRMSKSVIVARHMGSVSMMGGTSRVISALVW